jgi:hypothetical protein
MSEQPISSEASRLIRFDAFRFCADVVAELDRRGLEARWNMQRECGLDPVTVDWIVNRRKIRDLETVFSVADWLSFDVKHYLRRREPKPVFQRSHAVFRDPTVDWVLFRECVSMFCGGNAEELSRRTSLTTEAAVAVLEDGLGDKRILAHLCAEMHLEQDEFDISWRKPVMDRKARRLKAA